MCSAQRSQLSVLRLAHAGSVRVLGGLSGSASFVQSFAGIDQRPDDTNRIAVAVVLPPLPVALLELTDSV